MGGFVGLAMILLGMAALVFLHGQGSILGLPAEQTAWLIGLAAFALVIAGWVVQAFRSEWARGLQALVFWFALMGVLAGSFQYRSELQDVAARIMRDVSGIEPVVGDGGEVTVSRRIGSTFIVTGHANGKELRFIFDTGASAVVLTAESAGVIGFASESLSYVVPVFTANGATMAAPVTLETLRVGSITERRVRALVARPGVLRENLLGMTFLERLTSYEVRGNRLILRGRGA
jgi:aspartyl protease family protein